jgi:hypothetical protein
MSARLRRRVAATPWEKLKIPNEPLVLIIEDPWVDPWNLEGSGTTEYAHPSCIPLDGNWIQLGESPIAGDSPRNDGGYATAKCLFCGKGDPASEAAALREAAKARLIRHWERRAKHAKWGRVFAPVESLFAVIGVIAVALLVLYKFGPQPSQPTQVGPPPATVTTTPTTTPPGWPPGPNRCPHGAFACSDCDAGGPCETLPPSQRWTSAPPTTTTTPCVCPSFPHQDGCSWPDGPCGGPPTPTTTPPGYPPSCAPVDDEGDQYCRTGPPRVCLQPDAPSWCEGGQTAIQSRVPTVPGVPGSRQEQVT